MLAASRVVLFRLARAGRDRAARGAAAVGPAGAQLSALARFVEQRGPVSRVVAARLDDCRARGATPEREQELIHAWLAENRWR